MNQSILEVIRNRRSVRRYNGEALRPEDLEKLEAFIPTIETPFDVPVDIRILRTEEYGLSSPVITGEKLYVAGMVEAKPLADAAFGFSFEKLVLFAWSLGIGTTWIAGTMKREKFQTACGLAAGWRMPCISPLGYPAAKRSLKETMMRKGVGADSRLPAEKLFFDGSFRTPLAGQRLADLAGPLELTRWAPSAVNKQPWRLVAGENEVHFYEKKDKGYVGEETGDLQKIDVGIALCHFFLGLEDLGKTPSVILADPGLELPPETEYVATVRV